MQMAVTLLRAAVFDVGGKAQGVPFLRTDLFDFVSEAYGFAFLRANRSWRSSIVGSNDFVCWHVRIVRRFGLLSYVNLWPQIKTVRVSIAEVWLRRQRATLSPFDN